MRAGKITKANDGYKVTFERILNHSIHKVWEAITNPQQLRYWFTDIEMEFRPGGKITFIFRDKDHTTSYGEIVKIEEPHRFEWTWEGELSVWELEKISDDKTRVIFTYSKLTADYAVNAPAGFHALLDRLEARLSGSEETHAFGTEENSEEDIRNRVLYAANVYNDFPELVKAKPVEIKRVYNAPVERVWNAITDRSQMKQWYFDLDAFELKEGFRFTFPGQGHKGEQYMHVCTILEVQPLRKLQYSWQYVGLPGYSIVTFMLEDEGGKTRLHLTHHGIETFPNDRPDFAAESFNEGWTYLIGTSLPGFVTQKGVSA